MTLDNEIQQLGKSQILSPKIPKKNIKTLKF